MTIRMVFISYERSETVSLKQYKETNNPSQGSPRESGSRSDNKRCFHTFRHLDYFAVDILPGYDSGIDGWQKLCFLLTTAKNHNFPKNSLNAVKLLNKVPLNSVNTDLYCEFPTDLHFAIKVAWTNSKVAQPHSASRLEKQNPRPCLLEHTSDRKIACHSGHSTKS